MLCAFIKAVYWPSLKLLDVAEYFNDLNKADPDYIKRMVQISTQRMSINVVRDIYLLRAGCDVKTTIQTPEKSSSHKPGDCIVKNR